MKYSIIIPTYNHLEDCLQPCIESIYKNTVLTDVELVVVSNGSTDGTNEYLYDLQKNIKNLRIITTDEPLGYPLAVNMGLQISKGEYIVLLNNDTVILDFCEKGEWLDMLNAPFIQDESVGITGPSKLYCKESNSHFTIFFCAMLRRRMLDDIGILDLIFGKGSSEDIDLCLRAEQNGWKVCQIPVDNLEWSYTTEFPIYHKGEVTVHEITDWEEGVYEKNLKIIKDRTDRAYYSNFADVTCEISTKGRYDTTLPLAIMSIAQQELKPKKVIIFQDDFNPHMNMPSMQLEKNDMTKQEVYQHLLRMLDRVGIEWTVIFGEGKGQVTNHQKALEMSDTKWIWRLDDDNFAEPNVLRLLMEETADGVAAVAGSVVDPSNPVGQNWSTKMVHINTHSNVQWIGPGYPRIVPAEHLYSTFIYRRDAALEKGYDKNLSPVGHREETIFTYNLFKAGHKLLVNREAVTWHLRMGVGGIRSHSDSSLWARDEAYFRLFCEQWGVKPMERKWINLDGGRGDHYMFRMALPHIKETNPDVLITVASAFPECLEGEEGIDVVSVQDGINGCQNFQELNIYRWCMERKWSKSLVEAYKELYETK